MEYKWQTIPGTVPSKSNLYKIVNKGGHASLSKTDVLEAYEEKFGWHCDYRGLMISKPFEYQVRVYYPSKRADLDNSLKVQLDCLQHIKAIRNDNLCAKIVAEKFIDPESPRIEFRIITLD